MRTGALIHTFQDPVLGSLNARGLFHGLATYRHLTAQILSEWPTKQELPAWVPTRRPAFIDETADN